MEEETFTRSCLLAAVTKVVDVLELTDPNAIPPIAVDAVSFRMVNAVRCLSPGEIRHALALRIAEVHPPVPATGDDGAEGEPF
jgi:hypothetical protein